MSFDADILVVGGGPAGTSTALHLVLKETGRHDGKSELIEWENGIGSVFGRAVASSDVAAA